MEDKSINKKHIASVMRKAGAAYEFIGYVLDVSTLAAYSLANPDRRNVSMRKYNRAHATTTVVDGKPTVIRGLRKRPHPSDDKCEMRMCRRVGGLDHHHWRDPSVGMWLCTQCHMTANRLERMPSFATEYEILKYEIESEWGDKIKGKQRSFLFFVDNPQLFNDGKTLFQAPLKEHVKTQMELDVEHTHRLLDNLDRADEAMRNLLREGAKIRVS